MDEGEIKNKLTQAETLLAAAQADADRGEFEAAVEKLSQARALQPAADVATVLRRVERQIGIWERVQDLTRDGDAKRGNHQLKPALDAYQQAIREVMHPDSGLAEEVRNRLSRLVDLGGALHQQGYRQEADALLLELEPAAAQSRLVRIYLRFLIKIWHDLATRQALYAFIESRVPLKQWAIGYRAAMEYLDRYPGDERAVAQTGQMANLLTRSVEQSALKRLGRAEELRDLGVYDKALEALAEIKNDVIGPIEGEFPDLFEGVPEVEDTRRKAADLAKELTALRELAPQMAPLAVAVRAAVAENRLDDADVLFGQAELLDPYRRLKTVWSDLEALQTIIRRRRQKTARPQAQALLDRVEAALSQARTPGAAGKVVSDLAIARQQFQEVFADDEALRNRCNQLVARAGQRTAELEQVQAALQTAAAATPLEERYAALERAATVAQGQALEQVQAELQRLKPDVERLRGMNEAWHAAMTAWETGDYETARCRLAEASAFGKPEAEVAPYQRAAEAAAHLVTARELLRQDPEAARRVLRQVIEATKRRPLAEKIYRDASLTLEDAGNEIAKRSRVSEFYRAAESAFRQGRYADARAGVQELLALAPDHAQALDLWRRLDAADQATALLQQARTAYEAQRFGDALRLVDQALKLNPELLAMTS